jgi:hypothetical protein
MSRLKDLQPLPKLRVGNATGGAPPPSAMHSWSAMPATERSLPGSPNSSMADADMSVMSASDLTSIGFDSTVDCDAADIIAETPVRGGGGARGGANRRSDGDAGSGGDGGATAAGAGADLLTGMLRAPIQRGLLLIIDFMKAQGGGANADAARARSSRQMQVLLARCSEMATLALKRDVLSRAAALRALIARIPAMVSRREFAGMLSELQVCCQQSFLVARQERMRVRACAQRVQRGDEARMHP